MNSEEKILALFTGLNALVELPVMKLAENKSLVNEISNIVSSKNLWSIVNDITQEHRQRAYNQASQPDKANNQPNLIMQPDQLLGPYIKYQNSAHNAFSRNTAKYKPFMTQPVTKTEIVAFNALTQSPFQDKEITSLKETKDFIQVFNSLYSDRSLQIGTINDPTIMSSYIDYSPYIYNYQYYISIPTLSQTIDLPINIATRKMPKIVFEDKKLSEKIETRLRRTRYNEKRKKMLHYSSLSPRGALIVPILEEGRVRFNVFNDTQFTYASTQQYSKIDFKDNTAGVSQLFCMGHILQNEVTAHFLCPGFEPIFAIGKNKVFQLKDAAEAINIYLYTIKVLCIRAQVITQNWDGDSQNDTLIGQLKKLSDNISSNLSLSTALKIPKGAEVNILKNNLDTGFAEVSPIIKEYQGMLSGVMPDYFYGSTTAYSANAFNMQATFQNVHSQIQIDQLEPIDRFVINFLLEHDDEFKQYSSEVGNFDFEHESLYEPTESEKIDADTKKIDNLIKMHDYPELEQVFKREGLLREDHNFDGIAQSEEEET